MPTYGYECKECRHSFDFFQSMKDEPLKTCPECGKELRRLINGGNGIIFKGGGFYSTDKNGSSSKAVNGNSTESTQSACSACSSSETPACPKAAV